MIDQKYSQKNNEIAWWYKWVRQNVSKALKKGEFELFYQPRVNVCTGMVCGMEALARWRHPELGLLSAQRFIPHIEETHHIIELGEWALHEGCRQARLWQERGWKGRMAINVSGTQVNNYTLIDQVSRALETSGLEPSYLELELTESVLLKQSQHTLQVIERLKENGTKITLDDFGIAYSSLSYLARYPIQVIKLDRSLITGLPENVRLFKIIGAIIGLAISLDIEVVAEGVEINECIDLLFALGCHQMQGYYFSTPLPASVATQILNRDFEKGQRGC